MEKIALVTDTSCDLPQELFEKYEISRASMKIHFGEDEYIDQVTISHQDFYKRMLKDPDALPKTTQPQTKDYIEIFNNLKGKGYTTIIVLCISAKMSGALQAATLAAEMIKDLDIVCIDTKLAGPAQGLFVYSVAKEIKEGKSKDEIMSFIDKLLGEKPIVEIFFTVDSMKYLITNGRVGKAKGFVVDLLNIKPILTVVQGEIVPHDKARGTKGAIKKLTEIALDKIASYKDPLIFFAWGADEMEEKADEVLKNLKTKPIEIMKGRLAPTISCHSGPLTLTMTVMDKEFYKD